MNVKQSASFAIELYSPPFGFPFRRGVSSSDEEDMIEDGCRRGIEWCRRARLLSALSVTEQISLANERGHTGEVRENGCVRNRSPPRVRNVGRGAIVVVETRRRGGGMQRFCK